MRVLKYVLIVIALILVTGQFIRYPTTNPPTDPSRTVQARLNVPPDVARILHRSCDDCHSNDTVFPWYAHVAPVSWLVGSDVSEGRREMNFSDWARFDRKRELRRLQQICAEVREGHMPPWYYLLMHGPAKLTAQDKERLCAWTNAERARLEAGAAAISKK